MSEKEKKILDTVKKAVPNMSDFDKGYLLGFSESAVGSKKNDQRGESHAKHSTDSESAIGC